MTTGNDAPVRPTDLEQVEALYAELLGRWNARDADGFGALFAEGGVSIGFDGSTVGGASGIREHLREIFAHHPTGWYVGKVREARRLGPDVVMLQTVAGMMPPGHSTLNPNVNTVQSVVAVRSGRTWRIELFQNTPAAYHGRPEAGAALTAELQAVADAGRA